MATKQDIQLVDAQRMHQEHPKTFFVPCNDALKRLQPGDYVKIGFIHPKPEDQWDTERMWVCLTQVNPDGTLVGVLDNDPQLLRYLLRHADVVHAKTSNVMAIMPKPDLTIDQINDLVIHAFNTHAWLHEHHETTDLMGVGPADPPGSFEMADACELTNLMASDYEIAQAYIMWQLTTDEGRPLPRTIQ